mgnify:CR=1 FL=1
MKKKPIMKIKKIEFKVKPIKKKVVKHLKEDMKTFKREAQEDKELMSKLKDSKPKESPKARKKIKKVMHEFKEGELHEGSKKGPVVTGRKQAIAIALSEARRKGLKVPKKKKKK